jgi:hypothetical protein
MQVTGKTEFYDIIFLIYLGVAFLNSNADKMFDMLSNSTYFFKYKLVRMSFIY